MGKEQQGAQGRPFTIIPSTDRSASLSHSLTFRKEAAV